MSYHSMNNSNNKQHKHSYTKTDYLASADNEPYDMEKVVAILSYLTLLGWLVAIVLYGKHKSSFTSFHLRQSLGLIITLALLSLIPLIGWLMSVAVGFAWLYALFYTLQGQQKKVYLLGDFYQQHLDFIK